MCVQLLKREDPTVEPIIKIINKNKDLLIIGSTVASSDYGSQYTYRFGYASVENSQKLRKITTNLRTSMGGWEDEMERDSNVRFSRR